MAASIEQGASAAEKGKQKVEMVPSEAAAVASKHETRTAAPTDVDGITLDDFYPATIVQLKDRSLITEGGMQSTDGGRTWKRSPTFKPAGTKGLLRIQCVPHMPAPTNFALRRSCGKSLCPFTLSYSPPTHK